MVGVPDRRIAGRVIKDVKVEPGKGGEGATVTFTGALKIAATASEV